MIGILTGDDKLEDIVSPYFDLNGFKESLINKRPILKQKETKKMKDLYSWGRELYNDVFKYFEVKDTFTINKIIEQFTTRIMLSSEPEERHNDFDDILRGIDENN